MSLPFSNATFDAAVMALVIFFVPDPAKGLAEMARVVKPGGSVSAYVWDVPAGGLPAAPIQAEMRAMGRTAPLPPSFEVSRESALRDLWTDAGLQSVETRAIAVHRTFDDFEAFWTINLLGGGIAAVLTSMHPDETAMLKDRVRARMPADSKGRITCSAHANAVKGLVPK
jgi:SAM-dependent methyltransferase